MKTVQSVPSGATPTAPPGDKAPNIVVILLDDVGFAASSTFGGPIHTPAVQRLADMGLRYNRFHTTAICSPTRASLLTGRNPHAAGVGSIMNKPAMHSGYEGVLRDSTATVATILQQHGYGTGVFGKWHLTPSWESSQVGPFDRWPTQQGFDRFYGFLGGETHQWEPSLFEGTTPVPRPEGDDYHLTEDLVDQAITWYQMRQSTAPDNPFFLYLAPGATHAPLHAPRAYIDKYKGAFSQGWDAIRPEILKRQKDLGVVAEDAVLTPRPDDLPAWEDLSPERRLVAERLMETYAGFLEHTDVQVARLLDALEDDGALDNTLVFYIVGDNGASSEGGMEGSVSYMGAMQGIAESLDTVLANLDSVGGPDTYPHYPAAWAWAMCTPFPWVKQVASHLGGTRNPLVVAWPQRIADHGGVRTQFGHVNDFVPTVLDILNIEPPQVVNGMPQAPMDGTSLVYSFSEPGAEERHTKQYFEVFGHRSIYRDGWLASAFHGDMPWNLSRVGKATPFDEDRWELYDLRSDFSQAHDLAEAEPERLKDMQALFAAELARAGVPQVRDVRVERTTMPSLRGSRRHFVFHAGTKALPESNAPRLVGNPWTAEATLTVRPGVVPQGVIMTVGGRPAGLALFIDESGRPCFVYRTFGADEVVLIAEDALDDGDHTIRVDFVPEGPGRGRGADVTLTVDGAITAKGHLIATPPVYFSIDETFDIGCTTGSPVGTYPSRFPFNSVLHRVEVSVGDRVQG